MGFCFLVILTSYRSYAAFLYDPAESFYCENTVSKIDQCRIVTSCGVRVYSLLVKAA